MEESFNGGQPKKGLSKKVIAILIAILLVAGGSVAAYVFLTGSSKAQYFTAEKKTIDFMVDTFKERYEPEVNWYEQSKENPTETSVELSAEYNDPYGGYGAMAPQEIINNSTLSFTTQMDLKEKQIATAVQANIGGIEISDLNLYLDADKIMLGLPFLEETLQLQDKDTGKLIQEMEPTLPDGENIDFNAIFELINGLPEEDQEYLTEEYITKVYEEIPSDAFDSTEETIKVDSKTIDTEKITLHLSEQQVKDLFITVLTKFKEDERLEEMLKEQMEIRLFGLSPEVLDINLEDELNKLFGEDLDKAIEDVKDMHIPNGLTSIIWIKNDLIAKRDLTFSAGPSEDNISTITITGTHLLNDTAQKFDYEISNGNSNEAITITGDLSWKDNKANDTIKLSAAGTELTYEGTETLSDSTREFERVFSISSPSSGNGSLIWSGEATYNNDQMSSENKLSVEAPSIPQDMISLQIDTEAKTIKKVEAPDDSNVKDIGSMSMNELMNYFQTDVMSQYQQWLMGIMGTSGGLGL